jgi:hypothetical protein
MEAIAQEVEAQILPEARGNSGGSDGNSELSVLHSNDFEAVDIG